MQVRVLTLRFSPVLSGFDDTEVREFLRDKEVLAIRDHFFVKDESPYLAVLVTYNLLSTQAEAPQATPKAEGERQEAWREALQEEDWPLFNTLRDWRNQQAREEGVPPYVICTNRQLARIAHTRPSGLGKLGTVEGLGRAKIERYGGIILKLVGNEAPVAPEKEEGSAEQGECQPS